MNHLAQKIDDKQKINEELWIKKKEIRLEAQLQR